MLKRMEEVPYAPMLPVSNAEMTALEALPSRDKDLMFPYIQLRPWARSKELSSTIERVVKAYGDRPFLADLCPPGVINERRPVHDTLDELRNPDRAYRAWRRFLREHDQMVPVIQIADPENIPTQVAKLGRLERGLGLYLPPPTFSRLDVLASLVAEGCPQGEGLTVVLDLGQRSQDLLGAAATTVGLIRTIKRRLPSTYICVSASSFPADFVGRPDQEIYERQHFTQVAALEPDRVIYSDRGSARAEKQMGGGGTPAPRVDLAGSTKWAFFRDNTDGNRLDGYIAQAKKAKASDLWDGDVRVWGNQMIERTAGGDKTAIKSPMTAAAARINIHMHQQLFHGDRSALLDTDEEWTD